MIHKRLRLRIRRPMEAHRQLLHLLQVHLQRVQEPTRLQVLRARAHADPVILDDIPDPVAVCRDRPEAEKTQRRVAAVRRR